MSYKAYAMAQNLADELTKRLSALAVAVGADANGDTTITIGDGVAGHKNAFIRLKTLPTPLSFNIVGLASEGFTPTICELATEANYAGATDNVADILTPTELLPLLGTLANLSCRIDWYVSTNGTAPTVATITGAPSASFDSSLYGGMRSSQ